MRKKTLNPSTNKVNWGMIGTHALCTVVELAIVSIFEGIRYYIDIEFDKKEREAKEKELQRKEEDYGA
jgi:hypothetical protein